MSFEGPCTPSSVSILWVETCLMTKKGKTDLMFNWILCALLRTAIVPSFYSTKRIYGDAEVDDRDGVCTSICEDKSS